MHLIHAVNCQKLEKGMIPHMEYFDCLQKDFERIKQYMTAVDSALLAKYKRLPAVDSVDRDVKITCLQKALLFRRFLKAVMSTVNEVLRAKTREYAPLTNELVLKVLNREWGDFFDSRHWETSDWSLNSEDIEKFVKVAVRDMGGSEEEMYKALFGEKISAYINPSEYQDRARNILEAREATDPNLKQMTAKHGYLLDGKRNYALYAYLEEKHPDIIEGMTQLQASNFNALTGQTHRLNLELHKVEDALVSNELLEKFGGDTILAFLEMIKMRPDHVQFGVLMSDVNLGAFKDKLDYLYEILQRGAEFSVEGRKIQKEPGEQAISPKDIEALSPTEINTIFSTIRNMLRFLYGNIKGLEKALGAKDSSFADSYISELANIAAADEKDTGTKEELLQIKIKMTILKFQQNYAKDKCSIFAKRAEKVSY
jgi:hypothetical protein